MLQLDWPVMCSGRSWRTGYALPGFSPRAPGPPLAPQRKGGGGPRGEKPPPRGGALADQTRRFQPTAPVPAAAPCLTLPLPKRLTLHDRRKGGARVLPGGGIMAGECQRIEKQIPPRARAPNPRGYPEFSPVGGSDALRLGRLYSRYPIFNNGTCRKRRYLLFTACPYIVGAGTRRDVRRCLCRVHQHFSAKAPCGPPYCAVEKHPAADQGGGHDLSRSRWNRTVGHAARIGYPPDEI